MALLQRRLGVLGRAREASGESIAPTNLMLLSYAGLVAVFPLMLFMSSFTPRWDSVDSFYAIASGVFAGLGFLFFYLALSTGEAGRVVVITATYRIVTGPRFCWESLCRCYAMA